VLLPVVVEAQLGQALAQFGQQYVVT